MSLNSFNHIKILGLSFIVPDNLKKNIDDYPHYFDNNSKKLARAKKIIGYGTTYPSPEGVTAVDMCEVAANDLLTTINIDKQTIDGLIFVSQSADYIAPPSSNILHSRLELSEECALFDLTQGCTGFVYGLWTASSLIESKACKRILLLCSDFVTDFSDNGYHQDVDNKISSLIFSSGACAVLIEYIENTTPIHFHIGSRGSGYEQIIRPAGGARLLIDKDILDIKIHDKNNNTWSLTSTFMDGLGVFNFTMEVVPKHIQKLMKYAEVTTDDIDFFAIHQANKQIVKNVAELSNIPENKYNTNTFTKYGNMGGGSSICNLIDSFSEQLNKKISKVAVISFGTGLSWASTILDIGNIYCSGIKLHRFEKISTRKDIIEYWINKFKNYSGS